MVLLLQLQLGCICPEEAKVALTYMAPIPRGSPRHEGRGHAQEATRASSSPPSSRVLDKSLDNRPGVCGGRNPSMVFLVRANLGPGWGPQAVDSSADVTRAHMGPSQATMGDHLEPHTPPQSTGGDPLVFPRVVKIRYFLQEKLARASPQQEFTWAPRYVLLMLPGTQYCTCWTSQLTVAKGAERMTCF